MLGFIKNVARGLTVGPSNAQIAVVSFSDTARIEFQFGEHDDHASLEKAINSVNYDAMGTATSEGIKLARESIFKNSSRKSATKVALVITDGSSDSFQETVKEAKTTREEGIVLFALGIGNINKAELYAIASPPDCTHVIILAGFSEIDNVVQEIKKSACRAPIVVDSNSVVGINGTNVDIHGIRLNVTYKHSIHTTTTLAFVTQKRDSNITGSHNVLEVKVNCGVVQVYTSFDNPHPSSVFYNQKLTATDGHPALLFLNKTADGRPLYVTSVGTPYGIKGKNCTDANYFSTFAHINISKVDVICREEGLERPCTKKDFELKPAFKDMVCKSGGMSVPNPCSTTALQRGEFYHPHPNDDTKFIRCDYQQKMYVIQCPDGQQYTNGSDSCGTAQVAVGGDRVSLDLDLVNPCTPQSLINHRFFFSYPKDNTKYIHCDVWGHAWVSNCSSSMVWSQSKQTCTPDVHTSTNPCTQDKVKQGYTMFPHQDPHKYIHCDNALNPWVQSCTPNTVFNFASQNCVWETAPVGWKMDANKKVLSLAVVIFALSLKFCSSAVDRTREDRAVGADIVQAVVDIIRENCIYPNDRIFLRRLAFVESKDGLSTDTFRPHFYGGIWQIQKSEFESTKHCYGLEDMCLAIKEKLHIDWRRTVWQDLTKPLYSGLAASLKLQQLVGNNTPGVLEKQADFWVHNYHKGRSASQFITEVNKIPDEKCQIDLAFMLDGSGSIAFLNFLRMLEFVKNTTKQFEIGSDAVEVAVISFSDYARVEFGFGQYNTHSGLNIGIDNIQYDAGGTNTASAIRVTRTSVFGYNSRPNAVKVGLVITDGYSNYFNSTVQEAFYAKEDGIVLFAIGIGNVNEVELNEVASSPNCTHVFFITEFSDIDTLVYEIKKAACRAPVVINLGQTKPPVTGPVTDIFGSTISPTATTGNNGGSKGIENNITANGTKVTISVQTDIHSNQNNKTSTNTMMNVSVNCGIVHVYTSYDNPHPSPVLYNDKLTATDGHPAVLYINRTVDGRQLYVTFVGTKLPPEAAGLKNCSDAKYQAIFITENKTGINGLVIANPCTATAIQNNEMYHPHPYDDTKFIKCDYQQKMYVTLCPSGERYHQGSHSCGSTTATISKDKTPLDPDLSNPCTAQALMNHQFFFAYSRDKTKFIHCDVWGHAWIMLCASNLVWNQQSQTCIEDTHTSSNPCTQDQLDKGITMFPHQDPHKYIHCDNGLNPWLFYYSIFSGNLNSLAVFDKALDVLQTILKTVGWLIPEMSGTTCDPVAKYLGAVKTCREAGGGHDKGTGVSMMETGGTPLHSRLPGGRRGITPVDNSLMALCLPSTVGWKGVEIGNANRIPCCCSYGKVSAIAGLYMMSLSSNPIVLARCLDSCFPGCLTSLNVGGFLEQPRTLRKTLANSFGSLSSDRKVRLYQRVEKSDFESTKQNYRLTEKYKIIHEKLNIAWETVQWRDLTKPLYSGLAASLVLELRAGRNTPGVLEKQAEFWKNYYHPDKHDKSTEFFISQVQNIHNVFVFVADCQIDMGFILDESGSIGMDNFLVMLDFVKNVTEKFEIGPEAVEVALVKFESFANLEFGFGTYNNHHDLNVAIDNANYTGGGTNIAAGIRLARESVFRFGSRSSSTKVGLVITDGCSNIYDTVRESKYAKDEGIVLFALGIGSICDDELESLASDPNCTHVFFLSGFSDIDSLIYEIQKAACRAPVVIGPSQTVTSQSNGTNITTPITHTIKQTLSQNKTDIKTVAVSTNNTGNDTGLDSVMQLTVNCGIVHVYMSYDNPHPSAALYNNKVTATDNHPAVLVLNKTKDGRPLYMTYVGTSLPEHAADLKNCSDAHYVTTISYVNKSGIEIVCRQNGHERECTKLDFQLNEKYKDYLKCSSSGLDGTPVPNPCTTEAIQNNELYHAHPYDYTKFIKCDYQHKMYITQCPQGERYSQGSHSCGSSTATITGDKTPLDPDVKNPCTAQTLANQEMFFPYGKDNSKFIHCDVWGNAWVMNCPQNLVWNQNNHACIEDTHVSSNPCIKDQIDRGITMFPHPDPHKYIHCDTGLNPWVQSCVGGTVFDFKTQNCVWENAQFGK
ncbi:uncharacterized protein LOC134241654 [Saccostrea cucullata]|uniref:uncharacterized protein LOC134241654 n=1 Tax=Saccostrea cuccullata TaxID=36930 RepID=UPI002ED2D884